MINIRHEEGFVWQKGNAAEAGGLPPFCNAFHLFYGCKIRVGKEGGVNTVKRPAGRPIKKPLLRLVLKEKPNIPACAGDTLGVTLYVPILP